MPEHTSVPPASDGPVLPTPNARVAQVPVRSRITGGFWWERLAANGGTSLPEGLRRLEAAGTVQNLRIAGGSGRGSFQGHYPFVDSDVFKWIEAASWELGRRASGAHPDPAGRDHVAELVEVVVAAQLPEGYLNTWFQLTRPDERFRDLRWGHELYCAGHLIQAGIAHHRSTGDKRLLDVARRFADHLDAVFGPGREIDGYDGHPGVETALVELHRETAEPRYLALAAHLLRRRGHGLVGGGSYFQDRVPVREATEVEGHAVRQLYLLAGVADVAAETGDPDLAADLAAVGERLWEEMVATRTYVTGGLGARHDGEAFGDPLELPQDRAYCETCAAVASVQWNWRMALLTGRSRYSDLIERTLYNGVLPGVSLDGGRWLYVNPLQVRDGYRDPGGDRSVRRAEWFRCACCPPNVMRLLAALDHYLAATDADGLRIHQYVTGRYAGPVGGHPVELAAVTGYPWSGRVELTVTGSPTARPWTLALRIPPWSATPVVSVNGAPVDRAADDGWLELRRPWRPGDRVVLDLDVRPRMVEADPRVDGARGCVALERGPVVYCLEGVDQDGATLDDVVIDPAVPPVEAPAPELLGGAVALRAEGSRRRAVTRGRWPYREVSPEPVAAPAEAPIELIAVPYFTWGNRGDGAMRVWIPRR